MSVSGVNSVAFAGKIKATKQGNEYEKSNEGKKYYPLVAVAGLTAEGLLGIGEIKKALNSNVLDRYFKDLNLENSLFGPLKPVETKMSKGKIAGLATGFLIATAGVAVGFGAILDAIINKTRKKDADKFAQTEVAQKRTNKGKKVCTWIGLGIGAISLLDKIRTKAPKKSLIATIPLALASWFAIGAIYDHGVNKFRNNLQNKADKAVDNEVKLDKKIEEKVNEKIEEKA
ncbi:MAG: hypothetical protein WCY19_08420 [Candidatus Gastranaerophilaceae bacterium]